MKSQRYLRVDLLEDRRLLAGLDVRVFEDPLSARGPDTLSIPAVERVVYLDLNADGIPQSTEPISVSDIDGIARFRNLESGAYLVRLLGSSKSQVQTTDTHPAPAGVWTGNLNATSILRWESDTQVWFASDQSFILLDIESGAIESQLVLSGRILSVAMESDTQGVALLSVSNSRTELVGFDLQVGKISQWSGAFALSQGVTSGGAIDKELVSVGGRIFLRRTALDGDELLELPHQDTWGVESKLTSVLRGFEVNAQIQPIGSDGFVICEPLIEGSRLTLLKYTGGGLEIIAQRDFDTLVRVSSTSIDSVRLAIETQQGIEILSASSGLPTLMVMDQAVGPTLFDTSRGLFWTLSKYNPTRLIGWTIAEGLKVFDVLFSEAGTASNAMRTRFSIGFRSDSLIGVRDGQIYRHSLSLARGTVAQVVDSIVQQVAIGIRSIAANNPPVLRPLSSIQGTEDKPLSIATSAWNQASSDSDGDSIYYILVRGGQLGETSWSVQSGGVYIPKADVNGEDQIVVQAYDGRGWSAAQTVSIQIQPVNDVPQGLLYSGVLAIPENRPGYVLGSLTIVDPDTNEVFDYSVSDHRFEVVGNTLKVRDTSWIPYQQPGWIDLSLMARSRANGDTIQRPERIFVVRDATPFHNDYNPADVDGDGQVTPLDPLVIINYLNSNGSGQIKPPGEGEAHIDLDVDGDGQVSPLDILIVINALNNASADAEGEKSLSKPDVQPTPIDMEDPVGLKKQKR